METSEVFGGKGGRVGTKDFSRVSGDEIQPILQRIFGENLHGNVED
jgi:hypothetical protein